jgi:hypothetical protein
MGGTGSAVTDELVSLARAVELQSVTDAQAAADALTHLATAVRATRKRWPSNQVAGQPVPEWIEQLDQQLEDMARRLCSGHVKSISGLERRIRQFVLAIGSPAPTTGTRTTPKH